MTENETAGVECQGEPGHRRRICVLQDRLRSGGTERNAQWLVRKLSSEETAAHLLLFTHPRDAPPPAVPDWSALRTGQRLRGPDCFAPGLVRRLRSFRADTVICMGRNANCYGFWIKKCLPSIGLITSYRTNRHLPWAYRKSIRLSDSCVVNSCWAANELRRIVQGFPTERIATIHNPLIREHLLEMSRGDETKALARRQLGLPVQGTVCVNVSHFVAGKNQSALLQWLCRACQKDRQWTLLLAGEGPEKVKCQQLAKQLAVSDHVRFVGCVEAIEPLLQAADLYLTTSLREGLPNALVEAQAAGLPVITYDTAGSREALVHNASGYLTPVNDLSAFAAAVEDLRANPSKRSAFSACARRFAREHFDPVGIRGKYCEILAPGERA